MRRLVGKRRRGAARRPGHHPALLLDAEIGGASDLAVGRLDAIADDLRAAAGELVELRNAAKIERTLAAPFGLAALG